MEKGYVKVWNDGPVDHDEDFQGEHIHIPRGKFIEMPRSKALTFLEQWRPFNRSGAVSQQGLKALRIEEDPEEHAAKRDQPLKFVASDGKKFRTKQGLAAHEDSLSFKGGKGGKNKSA